MTPLMRKRTFLTKWALPYALVTLVLLWQWRGELTRPEQNHLSLLTASLALFIILFFVIRQRSRNEPDEVLDCGAFLQFIFGDRVETVYLSNVAKVEIDKLLRLTRITLHLRVTTSAGQTITFYPLQERNASGENVVAAALLART